MWLNSRVIYENVYVTEIILHLFDKMLCPHFFGNIFNVGFTAPAMCVYMLHNFFNIDGRYIIRGHECTTFCKGFCKQMSTSLASPRDQNNFIFEIVHAITVAQAAVTSTSSVQAFAEHPCGTA